MGSTACGFDGRYLLRPILALYSMPQTEFLAVIKAAFEDKMEFLLFASVTRQGLQRFEFGFNSWFISLLSHINLATDILVFYVTLQT